MNRYGRWTIESAADYYVAPNGRKHRMVVAICDCGITKIVRLQHLTSGLSTSCGCYKLENIRRIKTKHGHKPKSGGSPLWRAWVGIHTRCYNLDNPDYPRWGGRGIQVCARWHRSDPNGFQNFVADMGEKPSPKHSIDRINNEWSYMPSNCRWATTLEQRHNRRDTVE
jgi:hypothetical protein